jgi:hypothetical protein
MKATQENTYRLATAYFIGTIITGIGWTAWNIFLYINFYDEETAPSEDDDLPPLTRDDFITVCFFTVAMPLFVWGVCCARAWEFRRLIGEAEEEAAERIRSQVILIEEPVPGRRRQQQQQSNNDDVTTTGRELSDLSTAAAPPSRTAEIV